MDKITLWNPESTLKVSFKKKVPRVYYEKKLINKTKIIEWMNEWSPDDDSCVPKFVLEETFGKGDVRIDFDEGKGTSPN